MKCAGLTNGEEVWKVKWERINGSLELSEWMPYRKASGFFDGKMNETVLDTVWAELIYTPSDDEVAAGVFEDVEIVFSKFDRRVGFVAGKKVILGV